MLSSVNESYPKRALRMHSVTGMPCVNSISQGSRIPEEAAISAQILAMNTRALRRPALLLRQCFLRLFSQPSHPKPVAILNLLPINFISIKFRLNIDTKNCIDIFDWWPITMNLNEMQNGDRGRVNFTAVWNPNLRIWNQHTFSISQLNFPAYLADWELTNRLNQSLKDSDSTGNQLQTLDKRCRNLTALKFRPYVEPSNIDHPRQSVRRDLPAIGGQIDVMYFIIHFLPRYMRNRLSTRGPEYTPHIGLQKIR